MIVKMEMENGVQLRINGDEIKITLLDGEMITVNSEGKLETSSQKSQTMPESYGVIKEAVTEMRV